MSRHYLPLAITGVGAVSGLGVGRMAFASALSSGQSTIQQITAFDTASCRSHLGAAIAAFDPGRFVDAARLRRIDRVGQLALMGCGLALEDSGLLPPRGDGSDNIGVALGSYTAGLHSLVDYLDRLNQLGPIGASALDFSNTVGNAAASLCGLEFGLRGPNVTVSHREASGLAAVAFAASLVRSGKCRAVVTGAMDDFERTFFTVHDHLGVLAHDDGSGEASRPFDRRRNGFVLGSGAFTVVLESHESATARGAAMLGELLGVGATSSPTRPNDWPTAPEPLARAIRLALEEARIEPADVSVVFASANSTPTLDRVEAIALSQVFGPRALPVVAVKGALGESGASSAGSLTAALAALGSGPLSPTLGCEWPDDECPVDVVPVARALGDKAAHVALVNAFASGGANFSVVVRASKTPALWLRTLSDS